MHPVFLHSPPTSRPRTRAGERYDGEWAEGQEAGIGVFTWRDGSTYEGFWEGGRKAGVGVFRPAPNAPALPGSDPSVHALLPGAQPPPQPPPQQQQGQQQTALKHPTPPRSPAVGSPTAAGRDGPVDSPAAAAASTRQLNPFATGALRVGGAGWREACRCLAGRPPQHLLTCHTCRPWPPLAAEPRGSVGAGGHAPGAGGPGTGLVYVCQYEAGRLVHEEALSTHDLEQLFGPLQVGGPGGLGGLGCRSTAGL